MRYFVLLGKIESSERFFVYDGKKDVRTRTKNLT
jgi:hypothetical protein